MADGSNGPLWSVGDILARTCDLTMESYDLAVRLSCRNRSRITLERPSVVSDSVRESVCHCRQRRCCL